MKLLIQLFIRVNNCARVFSIVSMLLLFDAVSAADDSDYHSYYEAAASADAE